MEDNMNQLYERWLDNCKDEELLSELKAIQGNEEQINDRFYCELAFGTGGLRGEIGAGQNRMNIYTVGKATQGLADYLKEKENSPSIAIAHDNRKNSDLFADRAAAILAANGVKVYLYPVLTPTPMLSWAVRYFRCSGGIVITASHNPAVYNGYKVYGPDGCQITDDAASTIEKCISKIDIFDGVKNGDFGELVAGGMIEYIDEKCSRDYLKMISELVPGSREDASDLSIVYTPLNGTGRVPVLSALRNAGFENISIVKEQEYPDPAFPTCPYPNPEIKEALKLGIEQMEATGADLLLATDPDCDRVGTAVRDNGKVRLMTGNEIGILLMDYICRKRIAEHSMPDRPVMVKTIVTTEQAKVIAEHYGIEIRDVLTGFKYIGEQIGLLEKEGTPERFLFGFEESYGYLSGTSVRDKDGVNAALLVCRMTAEWKKKGMTLADALRDVQRRFGTYEQSLESITFKGENGMHEMRRIMDILRTCFVEKIGGALLTHVDDYQKRISTDRISGKTESIDLPVSNVLRFRYGEDFSLVIRPSGTEPKLKIYYAVRGQNENDARDKME
ncbi:MAG: phosphoglucomutase, partial [Clostridiales bacterium]|nr:phosphoglucomutase [Clostridiales bacterium]